jgi:hypothetical protein
MMLIMIDPRAFGPAPAVEPTPSPVEAALNMLGLNAALEAAVPCVLFHSCGWPMPIGRGSGHCMLVWQIDEGRDRKSNIRHYACFVGLN